METVATICEIVMVLCFGASWPFNIARAYKARTAKGTSLQFTFFIGVGYLAGILSKVFAWLNTGSGYWNALKILAFVFYFINLGMIITSTVIYFRNKKLDAQRESGEQENK